MNPFKRLFNRKQDSKTEALKDKSTEVNCTDEVNSTLIQQINARDINNSPIFQIINNNPGSQIIDDNINANLEIIRKSRFFVEYNTTQAAQILAQKISDGELCGGSSTTRSYALAWCSRFIANTDNAKAEKYLKLAQTLNSCVENSVAEAFIYSSKGDKNAALRLLADLTLHTSCTAALMIVNHHEGAENALKWFDTVGCNITDLDSDGKYYLLNLYLQIEDWDSAEANIKLLTDSDLFITPALNYSVAVIYLVNAVPDDLRSIVINQVPFNAATFPLSADVSAIESLRKAHSYFVTASELAQQLGVAKASKLCDEFAIWLELKDPQKHSYGLERLMSKLREPKTALHLIPLGLSFGLSLDLGLVEAEIDRQIALCGSVTKDTATALFSLALTKQTPEDVAEYIDRHHEQLSEFYDIKSLRFFEIEMLAQANMPDKARDRLDVLIAEGLSEAEENRLRKIVAEIEGTSLVEILVDQYERTNATIDLIILVEELERRGKWNDLCKYCGTLFNLTHTVQDAERLAKAYYETRDYESIVNLLRKNSEYLLQSRNLHMLFCWALFFEGALVEAISELKKYDSDYDNPNYRTLLVNLKIFTGDWNSLTAYIAIEWSNREKRTAEELLGTAQLAYYVNSPFAKQLTIYAAEKGNNNPGILGSAYLLASNAGWEDDATPRLSATYLIGIQVLLSVITACVSIVTVDVLPSFMTVIILLPMGTLTVVPSREMTADCMS